MAPKAAENNLRSVLDIARAYVAAAYSNPDALLIAPGYEALPLFGEVGGQS